MKQQIALVSKLFPVVAEQAHKDKSCQFEDYDTRNDEQSSNEIEDGEPFKAILSTLRRILNLHH